MLTQEKWKQGLNGGWPCLLTANIIIMSFFLVNGGDFREKKQGRASQNYIQVKVFLFFFLGLAKTQLQLQRKKMKGRDTDTVVA